jgi:hypothetical protein
MARTRAHRRRQTLRVIVALIVTFVVLVFGREVSRSAHQETSARLSENLSFAQLASTLLTQENTFDTELASLLTTGARLTGVAFSAQLSEMTLELSSWRDVATQMKTPVLSPDLNTTLSAETLTRVSDYDVVLAYVAQALGLSGPSTSPSSPSLGAAQSSLLATAASWGNERHLLSEAPGHVTLAALHHASASLNVPGYVQTLVAAPSLAASRAIIIAAIQVQPAPFPAPALTLSLAPTTTVKVQVSVSNLREITQPVTLAMVFNPSGGTPQEVTDVHTLAPLTSFAFTGHTFSVFPGEKGTLSVTLNGVPASAGLLHNRTYSVSVSATATG